MTNLSRNRFGSWLACLAALFISATPTAANQQQLQALLAKHFLRNHQAIPLHNNGNVKSGEVLRLPSEGRFTSRDRCYTLPPVHYTSLGDERIETTLEIAADAAADIPVQKIVQIEAAVGGQMQRSVSILLKPLSQEEPPGGFIALRHPKPISDCDIIEKIWKGAVKDYILVTRVFHGKENASVKLTLAGNAKGSADIEKTIRPFLGSTPKVNVQVSGSDVLFESYITSDEQSLAVQSAVINVIQLARIYLRFRTDSNGARLEALVQEYLTGTTPGLLTRIKIQIEDLLRIMEVRQASAGALYSLVFSGEGAQEAQSVGVEPPQWSAIATIAAAHEIVGEAPARTP
jgi:hypothetical protein